uniref:Coiled-coil transcriptional coactivator n=1 Tax=Takifugu rubripes TaxID=31033 RepID=Q1KKV5_TAKRU|nr:coiled-coil transcriptional coactivator [Takifugu rubripes]
MEKCVEFRNVGCSYFPQSRVDCHYTISSQHTWASNDWVGLFKMGWTSVRDYHTFVWALVPPSYEEGTEVNCCVQFQAAYLPKASCHEYEFVYISAKGEVCSRSSSFIFCAPKPLEDLVTLEEDSHGEEGGTDMLLVVPRAELLQNRLQECLQERAELLQAHEATNRQREKDKLEYKRAREAWDRRRSEVESDISRLQRELKHSHEQIKSMERKQEEEQDLVELLTQEKSTLLEANEESRVRIRELEEDIKTLTQRTVDRETEMERMKERAKRAGAQRKEEESERSALQAEHEATLKEMRSLQERLNTSERASEGLKSDLSSMVAQRDRTQSELHQARLQAAQLTLQLADASLALREGRARWAQERQGLQLTAEKDHARLQKLTAEMETIEESLQEERMERVKLEVEIGREKDCNRVQLCETRRELQELKTSVRVTQKEKEQLLAEKQELMHYICQLEQKTGTVSSAKWSAAPVLFPGRPASATSDSEDENPEALQPLRPPRPLGNYSLCEQGELELLRLATPPPSPREAERSAVVINQPAPLTSPHQASAETAAHSSDSEEESDPLQCGRLGSGDETALLLPEHPDTPHRYNLPVETLALSHTPTLPCMSVFVGTFVDLVHCSAPTLNFNIKTKTEPSNGPLKVCGPDKMSSLC